MLKSKQQKPICVAFDQETLDILDNFAVNKGLSRSIVIRGLVHDFIYNEEIFPVAVSRELKERIKKCAISKGRKVEDYVERALDKIVIDETDFMPVVLKIPKSIKGDKVKLKEWLDSRVNMLMGYFSADS